jgi:outer membrane immunogenic protein
MYDFERSGESVMKILAAVLISGATLFAATSAMAQAPSWTGFYFGLNAGYSWQKSQTNTFQGNDPASRAFMNAGFGIAGATVAGPASYDSNNPTVGIEVGYNFKFADRWVAGVEADANWGGFSGSGVSNFIPNPAFTAAGLSARRDVTEFGTARGRLGFLATDSLLLYGTGGFAWGLLRESIGLSWVAGGTVAIGGAGFLCGPGCGTAEAYRVATGWTAGGGFEWALTANLNLKAEYLYVNLGAGDSVTTVLNSFPGTAQASITSSFSDADFHVVRLGFNLHY